MINARNTQIINVLPAFETVTAVTAMSESTEGQPLLPTASVMSMFNAGNKDDADNSEQAGIAKLQHRGTDSKGTGKNLANEEANAGFMSNDTRNDPSVKLNEDKAKALQNIQTITTPAHADPPPVPEERPLVDANTRETEFVSVQKAGERWKFWAQSGRTPTSTLPTPSGTKRKDKTRANPNRLTPRQ